MTSLLPLEPQGLGTGDVESMACFIARLANVHGVNTYQFVNALRDITGVKAFGHGVVGRCAGRNSLLLSGFGHGAQSAIEWLQIGLGDRHWASLTLMPFKGLLPLNGTGVLRPVRAWCPACLWEMRHEARPEYEKLTWMLRWLNRCPIHSLRLHTACPSCGAAQLDYRMDNGCLSRCRACGVDMIASAEVLERSPVPAACEADLISVIAASAANPGYSLQPSAVKTFLGDYLQNLPPGNEALAAVRKAGIRDDVFKKPSYQPTLYTAIKLSLVLGVSLQLMLESPQEAAKAARFDKHFTTKVSPRPRAFRSRQRRAEFLKALEDEMEKAVGVIPNSLKHLCRRFGVSPPTAEYWYPHKCEELVRRYRAEVAALRASKCLQARSVLAEHGVPTYARGDFRSQDEVVDWAHKQYGLSKSLLRRELLARLMGPPHNGADDP